jgi:hypothetical protein
MLALVVLLCGLWGCSGSDLDHVQIAAARTTQGGMYSLALQDDQDDDALRTPSAGWILDRLRRTDGLHEPLAAFVVRLVSSLHRCSNCLRGVWASGLPRTPPSDSFGSFLRVV